MAGGGRDDYLIIWAIFVLDFILKLTIAPSRLAYLKGNWLVAISLVVPALRVFRLARAIRVLRMARAARGLRLVRIVSALNRSSAAMGAAMKRRGFGYVALLSVVVTFAGAAGMYAFENSSDNGLTTYGEAIWWTAMLLTSIGSEYWPKTPEGRTLCFLLAVYGFAVFGYVTATLATFFIGRDATDENTELAGAHDLRALREEIAKLREEIQRRAPH